METFVVGMLKCNNGSWNNLERPLVSTISRMLRSKALVPHDIIHAEMGATSVLIEALFLLVTYIQQLLMLSKGRYSKSACTSSRQLAEHGDIHCWYAEMQLWFTSHGISINALSLFQYCLDCSHLNMIKVEDQSKSGEQDNMDHSPNITWYEDGPI